LHGLGTCGSERFIGLDPLHGNGVCGRHYSQ
jgi:hypothetical protein